jgi:hypothetical protein
MNASHPYLGLPDYQFWKNEPAIANAKSFDPVTSASFVLSDADSIVTAGSCFAQHVARHLTRSGFRVLVTERAHPIIPDHIATGANYGIFSARYGNIYTAKQLKQLLLRAYGQFDPIEQAWAARGNVFVDPMRPQIQPGGFISAAEVVRDRSQHLAAVREAVEGLTVFVFTLGLTEAWQDTRDGTVFPLAPGVAGGTFDPQIFSFRNFTASQTAEDLHWSLDFIRKVNPAARFLITVSPVPLNATAVDRHVFVSTTYSKAALRVAAEDVCRSIPQCEYFPSFEIITSPYARGAYFAADCRSVTEAGVDHVMRVFLKHYGNSGRAVADAEIDVEQVKMREHISRMEKVVGVLCDEELLSNAPAPGSDAADGNTLAATHADQVAPGKPDGQAGRSIHDRSFVFGPLEAPAGGFAISAGFAFSSKVGFGWLDPRGMRDVDRGPTAANARSLVLSARRNRLRVLVPPGTYACTARVGDPKGVTHTTILRATGIVDEPGPVQTSGARIAVVSFGCVVANGPLDIDVEPGEGGWALISLEIRRVATLPPTRIETLRRHVNRWNLPPEGPNGPRALFARWRAQTAEQEAPEPTGLTRRSYLEPIEGCVDYFRSLQAESGAIIDPQKEVEFQYSTPCFAYAAALVAAERDRADLLAPAMRAFRFAAKALGERTAANGHEDFYPAPLAHAFRLLAGRVPAEELAAASAPLGKFDPYATYRKKPGGSGLSGSNWNCKALAGHHMLVRLGLHAEDGYAAHSLLGQGLLFNNEFGLYAEGPMTYDAFPRAWLGDMLDWGYDGPGSDRLREALERGALSSLLMQSPTGELPAGGRSSHHLWSDALQSTIFERGAGEALAHGDLALCGVFKRAARRALAAMLPWRRASGEFFVVKNRKEPSARHGFEPYTSHSQYNLLAATALGFAHELAGRSDSVPEQWTPAECGRSLFHVESGINKLFASVDGTQVELATAPTPRQTPLGLIRIQMRGLPGLLPMTDGLPHDPLFELPGSLPGGIALGLAWPDERGRAQALDGSLLGSLAGARHGETSVTVEELDSQQNASSFLVRYDRTGAGPPTILERYDIRAGHVSVAFSWSGWDGPVMLRWPVFAGDGASEARVSRDGHVISSSFQGATARFAVSGAVSCSLGPKLVPFRNGDILVAEALAGSDGIRIEITGNLVDAGR